MKIRVAVFFGGESCEHEVSIISANQVMHALDKEKYDIFPIYIAKNKDMYTSSLLWEIKNYADLNELLAKATKINFVKDGEHVYFTEVKRKIFKPLKQEVDVAFLVMHGTGGEDGTLQGYLEMLSLPYTSSGVLGAAVGQDKEIMKQILAYNNLPIVKWLGFRVSDILKDFASFEEEVSSRIGFPCIIKPANLGSSIGIEIVRNSNELKEKVKNASKFDFKIVVEEYLNSFKEVNCSVIGDLNEAQASYSEEIPRVKVTTSTEFLDYNQKYLANVKSGKCKMSTKGLKGAKGMASLTRLIPAPIGEELNKEIKDLALKTFKVLNAFGLVRIDFMVVGAKIYINEINSIPGSLAYYLWQASGDKFEVICDKLIHNALMRANAKKLKVYSFESNILKAYGGK